jgi:hypothetical protein
MVTKLGDGRYRCNGCGATITIADNSEDPVVVLVGRSGEQTERVVTVAGVVVHQCLYAEPAPQPER